MKEKNGKKKELKQGKIDFKEGKSMGIELKPCIRCGGDGKLIDFEHRYNPKNKTIKFLNSGNGLRTWAECKSCKRSTESFIIPIEAINKWNMGEIYNEEEYRNKLEKEYIGKIFSEDEIKNSIIQTKWDTDGVEIKFTNGDYERIFFDKYNSEFVSFDMSIYEKEINKLSSEVLNYIKERNLKVKEMEYIKN